MNNNCFIYETLNDVKTLNVKKTNEGLMHLSGVFGVCGVRNNNRRIYETSNYAKMVSTMQERIKKAPIPGELEHPQTMNITLENISHRIDSINIDENGIVSGEITLLDTPKGRIAQAIVEGGLPLFISSRATGAVDPKSGVVTLENLATYDLVGSPGFSQAELHLNENQKVESLCESVYYIVTETKEPETNDNNNNNNTTMNEEKLNSILEEIDALKSEIANLKEENEDLKSQIENIEESHQDIDIEKLADGIQKWIVEEYSPVVQKWVVEEYSAQIEKWVNEEFAPEHEDTVVESARQMFIEKLAPRVEKWVIEEFSPEVEHWCTEEFSRGIQKWVIEEFSPEVEKWCVEEYKESVAAQITEALEASKKNNLTAIDETLKMLESIDTTAKPTYVRQINENLEDPRFIAEMPADARVKWDMASKEVKESIERRARLYNFANEGAVERFWQGIDFENVKPVNNIYEGLNAIKDESERAIRAQFRSWRARR